MLVFLIFWNQYSIEEMGSEISPDTPKIELPVDSGDLVIVRKYDRSTSISGAGLTQKAVLKYFSRDSGCYELLEPMYIAGWFREGGQAIVRLSRTTYHPDRASSSFLYVKGPPQRGRFQDTIRDSGTVVFFVIVAPPENPHGTLESLVVWVQNREREPQADTFELSNVTHFLVFWLHHVVLVEGAVVQVEVPESRPYWLIKLSTADVQKSPFWLPFWKHITQ